jgi:TetR/AcrR family transcriptional repressor of nem operon
MGIGGASLYNAYGDKRALFERALERYANRSMRERIARIEARHAPRQAIGAFLAEIVDRSVKDPDCRGCLLVNSALDAAHGDGELAELVASYLGEIRAFFRRSLRACRRDGTVAPNLDVEVVADHLLGVVLAVRVLARTGARRRVLERVVQPALGLLAMPIASRRKRA